MSNPQPYLGLSTDRLTALINAKNALSLRLGVDFLLGPPQAYSDSSGRNTKVVLTPISDQYESVELHYWRLPLTALNVLPSGYVQPVSIPQVPFKLSDILPAINAALGLNLTAAEIIDQTYTTQQSSYLLPINEAVSLAWLDSNYQFPAVIVSASMTMDQLLPVASLPGFVKPGVDMTKLAVSMPGFDRVPLSEFAWTTSLSSGSVVRPNAVTPVSMIPLNGKIWASDGKFVYGLDPIDGTALVTLDIQGYLADTSAQSIIAAYDNTGLLYVLVAYGNSTLNKGQVIRVDTVNNIVKDNFYPVLNFSPDHPIEDVYGINSGDYIFTIKPQSGRGLILQFDLNMNLLNTLGLPSGWPAGEIFDVEGLLWDSSTQLLWIKTLDNGAGSTGLSSTMYVCSIDGSGNLTTHATFKLFNLMGYGTSANMVVYDSTDGHEFAVVDFDWQGTIGGKKQYYINRYNGTTGALIASQPLSADPRLDNTLPNHVVLGQYGGPLKYNAATDEFFLPLAYGTTQPTTNQLDIWAFKRKDFTQNRIVATHTATVGMFDFCIDDSGAVYPLGVDYTSANNPTIAGLLR